MSKTIATTVRAEGKAQADYDQAAFSLGVTKHAATGPKARESLKPVIDDITKALAALKKEGVKIDDDLTRSSYSVTPSYEYKNSKQTFKGYDANYTYSFVTTSLDSVSKIHDVLTALDGVNAAQPAFGVKNAEVLKKTALQDAFNKAKARFAEECAVLGKEAKSYEVYTWEVDYHDRHHGGGVRAMAMAAGAPSASRSQPIEVNSGKAEVSVELTVNYARRET